MAPADLKITSSFNFYSIEPMKRNLLHLKCFVTLLLLSCSFLGNSRIKWLVCSGAVVCNLVLQGHLHFGSLSQRRQATKTACILAGQESPRMARKTRRIKSADSIERKMRSPVCRLPCATRPMAVRDPAVFLTMSENPLRTTATKFSKHMTCT